MFIVVIGKLNIVSFPSFFVYFIAFFNVTICYFFFSFCDNVTPHFRSDIYFLYICGCVFPVCGLFPPAEGIVEEGYEGPMLLYMFLR